MNFKYDFSIIVAVYNVEKYLDETINSVLSQSIGLERIQLILVDDGSIDDSGRIIDKYVEEYPKNVIAIHQENGGAASARNSGLNIAEGKYINFLDGDDLLEANTLERVFDFFNDNYDYIDVVSIPMMFFESQNGNHPLNGKFNKGTRVIDVNDNSNYIQLSSSSAFIKAEAIEGLRFDTALDYAEDAKFVNTILFKKQRLGLIKENLSRYMYRKRSGGELSTIQKSATSKAWYIEYLDHFCLDLIDTFKDGNNNIPRYLQYVFGYDLQWRIKNPDSNTMKVLSEKEIVEYRDKLFNVYSYIDDDIIMSQKNLYQEHKMHILCHKYNAQPSLYNYGDDLIVGIENNLYFSLSNSVLHLEILNIKKDCLIIEGSYNLFASISTFPEFEIAINGQRIKAQISQRKQTSVFLEEQMINRVGFSFNINFESLNNNNVIKFYTIINGKEFENKKIRYEKFFPITNKYKYSYFVFEDNLGKYIVTQKGNSLRINRCSRKKIRTTEILFLKELKSSKGVSSTKAVFARIAHHILSKFKKRPIWLFSDRIMYADDNGEALFDYVRSNCHDIDAYYIISKESNDYPRLMKKGHIINALSFKHKILHLLCDYNISSQGEDITIIPFPGYHDPYRDILHSIKYVFLQHGVTKDDVSNWLNKYNKNIYGFITAAKDEHDSIVNGEYYYEDNNIWLTGFPRFDRLYDNRQKIITIVPTWRQYLMDHLNTDSGLWSFSSNFYDSLYFNFYHKLLNDYNLLDYAEKYNYKIAFFPHPNIRPLLSKFIDEGNNRLYIFPEDTKYRDMYAASSMLMTDYSSAVFDFAYMNKPIVYCQFDKDLFFSGIHVYKKGYFDYERDGFGEVVYDYESAIKLCMDYIKNDCNLKNKYQKRIDKFFAFRDKNNCKRVVEYLRLKDESSIKII